MTLLPARSSRGLVAGVCAGLARASGKDVRLIRLLFLLTVTFSPPIYVALWLLMPDPEPTPRATDPT